MLNLSGMKEPYYVLDIYTKNNEIIAGPKKCLYSDILIATDVHWIVPFERYASASISAKIRSASAAVPCSIFAEKNDTIRVLFTTPRESITPGQSVVFYAGDTILGGGIIDCVPRKQIF